MTFLALLSGCTPEQASVTLPKQSAREAQGAPGTPSDTAAAPESEAVKSAYRGFVSALERADSLPDATRKQQLATYMIDPQLSRVLEVVKEHKADHLATYGSVIVHINSVSVDGDDATLRDCQDATNAGLRDTRTDKKINRGVRERHVEATLKKGADGRWRVSKHIILGEGC
ncbi:hypothetical protein [Actinomadura sp. NBRC 104425]|uniref:hypothetical protein n=1 Tax=Actinomadura sp. NBRC 104425 TaxID=3032204 RepID=UPI00255752DD|nr:hypothetical protein [Actinomadura sp. NBRC 104425]